MKNKILKQTAGCMLACGLIASGGIFSARRAETASAAGKVAITPYIQYTFDSPDTMFDNTGSSAADETKDYTLQLLGNASPVNMCYMQDVEFKDNSALYLDGANNPFANGDLSEFTIAFDVTLKYSSWFSSVASWDGITGDADSGEYVDHKYMRVTSASAESDKNWLRFTDSQTMSAAADKAHWESYYRGKALYTGERTVTETAPITVIISAAPGGKLISKAYAGITEAETVSEDLSADWNIYGAADDTQKRFTLGGAYDSRNGQHLQMKMNGRLDNVRIYDFAMNEEQMKTYATSEEKQLFVDGVEVDKNIVGGSIAVSNDRPKVGEIVEITPLPDSNAELTEITVDGGKLEPVNGKYTAVMKEGGLFVSAKFVRSYSVSVASNIENGTITADKTIAKEGEKVTFTVTPNSGYKVRNVFVNGATVEEVGGTYSYVMQSEDMVVSAEFSKWLKITVKDGITGGSVTVNKKECWENESVLITVKADDGYEVKKVLVNGQEAEKSGTFYKYTVTEDSLVEVEFGKIGDDGAKKGCKGSIAGGSLGIAAMAAIAAVALKKKRK